MSFSALMVLILLSADVAEARGKLGAKRAESTAVVKPDQEFVHRLRACNAYTTKQPVEVIHHRGHKDKTADEDLTKAGPLRYKTCRDFAIHLQRGDSVEFTQNGSHVGSFAVASLPQRDALFLLVLHRRSGESKKPAFSSHIFTDNPKSAQLAVLDVYNGPETNKIQIHDIKGEKKIARSEMLSYDTVVSISPGHYDCELQGQEKKLAKIQALHGESYVAMRVGLKGEDGFPEDVIVFPTPSGAARMWQGCFPLALILMLLQ